MATRLLVLILPIALAQTVSHLGRCVERAIASAQGPGAVAALTYAFRLMLPPVWLVVIPLSVVLLPSIAAHLSRADSETAREVVDRGLSVMLFVLIPVSALTYLLRFDFARLLFQRGAFGPEATHLTGEVAGVYALSILPQALALLLARVAYARSDMTAPLKTAAAGVLVGGLSALALVRVMGLPGVPAGSFLGWALNAGLLVCWEVRRGTATGRALLTSILMPCLAAAPMTAITWFGLRLMHQGHGPAFSALDSALAILVLVVVGLALYTGTAALFRLRGFQEARRIAPEIVRAIAGRRDGANNTGL